MTHDGYFGSTRSRRMEFDRTAAIIIVASMIGVLFAGSTVPTPLYIIYKQQFGFSQISLTLIYAAYVIGNLAALLLFGRLSDQIGRRKCGIAALITAMLSALIFLFAHGIISLYFGRILSGLAIGIGAGTGTAWLAELTAEPDKSHATVIATSANFVGLGMGALISGVLAEYLPFPLQLPFIVYLVALIPVTALVWLTRETVRNPVQNIAQISLWARLSVPSEIRAQFVAPAVTGFGVTSLVGFYAAIVPSLLAEQLHEPNHATAGVVFLELAAVVALSIVATHSLSSRLAMLVALALMFPGVGLLVTAQITASMPILIVATAVCGVATGLGYRGSLQVVNQIAPEDRRAEVVSSYFVCNFSGNALPIIGVGVISTLIGSIAANLVFAAIISLFAVVALWFGIKHLRQ